MGPQSSDKEHYEEPSVQSQFIYISDIVRISRVNERIVIEQRDSESECLIFASVEKSKAVEDKIIGNAWEFIRRRLDLDKDNTKPNNQPRNCIRS